MASPAGMSDEFTSRLDQDEEALVLSGGAEEEAMGAAKAMGLGLVLLMA